MSHNTSYIESESESVFFVPKSEFESWSLDSGVPHFLTLESESESHKNKHSASLHMTTSNK